MSFRGLVVLVVLLAAAVAVLLRVGRAPEPATPAAPDAPLVRAFSEDAVREMELTCDASATTLQRAAPSGWRIVRPIEADADPRRVRELVAAIQDARVRKVIAFGKPDLAAFGLAPPVCAVRVDLGAGAPALALRLGRGSPVGSERYAATDDTRVVFTDASLYAAVSRGPDSFREKRLIPVEPADVTRISLARPSDTLALAWQDGGCRIEAPFPDAGSSSACAGLARALTSLELSPPFAARPGGDGEAKRRLRIEVATKDAKAQAVAYVAAAGIGGKRLAWRDGAAAAGLAEESAVSELERPAESFRETRCLSFSSPDVRSLVVERGTGVLRIVRAGEASAWTGAAGPTSFPVDGSRVGALLERLRDLNAAGFETAPPATRATATIAVAGEHGDLARLTFGPLAPRPGSTGELVWATTPSRPGVVFRLDASSLGNIPKDAGDLAPLPTPAAAEPGTR